MADLETRVRELAANLATDATEDEVARDELAAKDPNDPDVARLTVVAETVRSVADDLHRILGGAR